MRVSVLSFVRLEDDAACVPADVLLPTADLGWGLGRRDLMLRAEISKQWPAGTSPA